MVLALSLCAWAAAAAAFGVAVVRAPIGPADRSGLDRLDRDHRGARPAELEPAAELVRPYVRGE